ncbi:39S ribosomal protein L9, mitochondrial [Boleophthalmus pectinirostris]|uniref:39S ribosomal protein L9, mitochondrial n=1 Tax=Boleophthalmus pectinirostris TaxID=150288 RepID=UPI000A1C2BDB|nr:39S ribosomal protein L9, mitochondrial [Boleophthalmus pectinirostris]
MWSSCRRVLHELLRVQPRASVRSLSLTPAQYTVIVERWWQVPLSKRGSPPRLNPRRHRIYKLVEDTKHQPQEKMELILTQTVPKLGGRGDTVFVKKSVGRNKLLAQGMAVYPSPENKEMFAEEIKLRQEGKSEESSQTRTGQMTVDFLKRITLNINQMPTEDFQVTKEVVCRQFQKKFLLVVPPHALTLQQEPIKELGDYWCEVTVNKMDTVRIPLSIVPYEDLSASAQKLKAKRLQQVESTNTEPNSGEDNDLKTVPSDLDSVNEAPDVTTAPSSDSPKKE